MVKKRKLYHNLSNHFLLSVYILVKILKGQVIILRLLDKITARKIRDGDIQTFESLVNKHKDTVFNYCIRTTNDYHHAEELTQEVFIKVYHNIPSYDSQKASLSTWIFTIAHNICINSLRNSYREFASDEISAAIEPNSPEDKFIAKEKLDRLIEAIQSLTPEDRSLVIIKDYLGFKYKEVSSILNIPVGTVKSRLHNIRIKIRGLIGDFYD